MCVYWGSNPAVPSMAKECNNDAFASHGAPLVPSLTATINTDRLRQSSSPIGMDGPRPLTVVTFVRGRPGPVYVRPRGRAMRRGGDTGRAPWVPWASDVTRWLPSRADDRVLRSPSRPCHAAQGRPWKSSLVPAGLGRQATPAAIVPAIGTGRCPSRTAAVFFNGRGWNRTSPSEPDGSDDA